MSNRRTWRCPTHGLDRDRGCRECERRLFERSFLRVHVLCTFIAAFERGRDHTWDQIEAADYPARGTHFYDPR